ncbi:MAG: hypothetical protein EOP93_05645 [Lysobacteraceae bacterium]|nr:MAG: hypothetical protein EOP93_05645 [Xanthomonadaceae bacterium]
MAVLVACGDHAGTPEQAGEVADGAAIADRGDAPPQVPPGLTRGGDGSQIALQPLGAEQLEEADLTGELACSFQDNLSTTLLVARADVLPDGMVRAAINNHGYVETLGNARAGGFDDLVDGITLAGKGMTLLLARGAPLSSGDESTLHRATLIVQRADGAERRYEGTLACGP